MRIRPAICLVLLYFAVLLLPAGMAPLTETTEARYSEIAREMLASGDYLEPHLDGIKHFHKPPLTYWAIAAGMRLFGQNDFGARFFGIVAAVAACLFLYRLARLVLNEEASALNATLIFATSVLMLAVARIVSTDIYLTCFTIAAQYFLFRQIYGNRQRRNAILYGLCLGLGFLTKGPIIFLFTLLPYLITKIWDDRHRKVFTWPDIGAGMTVFLAISLPWYLLVIAKNPQLLGYFVGAQTIDRIATNRFHRYQPFWYFIYIFATTFLPYLFFLAKGCGRFRDLPKPVRLLSIYLLAPLLVFSLATSKLPTYILPFYGVASLFAADAYRRFPMPRLRMAVIGLLAAISISPLGAAFLLKPMAGALRIVLIASVVPAAALVWQAFHARGEDRFLHWVAATMLLFSLTGYLVFGVVSHQRRAFERLVEQINVMDPQRRLPVMVYKHSLPSVSFYRGELAVMALGDERETQFQNDASYLDSYLDRPEAVAAYLVNEPELFLVASPKDQARFADAYRYTCEELISQDRMGAYHCRRR